MAGPECSILARISAAPMAPFTGQVWRAVLPDQDPCLPVASPEGRFHHQGQPALYTSLTPEGCVVAIQRYLRPDDPPRRLVPLALRLTRLLDLRNVPDIRMVWQDLRAAGQAAPTWLWSDASRARGAEAMLYASRSRPDLTHMVILADPTGLILKCGAPLPWPSPNPR